MPACSTKSPPSSAQTKRAILGAVCFAASLVANPGSANELEFRSGTQQVNVVELYTSEGCSSCPPADRWFSKLKSDDGLWRDFVPLAFHVDYWDYIGWKDRFASAENSARQRTYARAGSVSTVYTPGFLVNGREWRGWFRGAPRPDSNRNVGELRARLEGDEVTVAFRPVDDGEYVATVAVLGAGLASEVRAGENRGRQLVHDFVVLGRGESPLQPAGGEHVGSLQLPAVPAASRAALAVWVSPAGQLAPVQATGGWLTAR